MDMEDRNSWNLRSLRPKKTMGRGAPGRSQEQIRCWAQGRPLQSPPHPELAKEPKRLGRVGSYSFLMTAVRRCRSGEVGVGSPAGQGGDGCEEDEAQGHQQPALQALLHSLEEEHLHFTDAAAEDLREHAEGAEPGGVP